MGNEEVVSRRRRTLSTKDIIIIIIKKFVDETEGRERGREKERDMVMEEREKVGGKRR